MEQIALGETPDGYVWHHSEVPGKMELVDEETHAQSAHTDGRSLWGGGSSYR
ncbi:HNH endonuclease [Ammoniphilus sp. YIM 78166]|uniref:HNH endonuclease n=1 Tax=Ammoniphilus sp. YIM 78166 TaxID=1644106 RepID=UPI001F0E0F63|nr:HNH endonuclease [Ammoniphilus sp. YIM 78166]